MLGAIVDDVVGVSFFGTPEKNKFPVIGGERDE